MKVCLIIAALFATCHCKIEFSERARNFSVELLYFTAEETEWHTVISPFGVWSLLTALSNGATRSSQKQLLSALILPKNQITLTNEYYSLVKSVLRPGTPTVALKSKNYLFFDREFMLKEKFIKTITKDFRTTVSRLSFKSTEEAQKITNTIIQRSKITRTNVLKSGDFVNSTMILTNIASFKALWKSPFNVSNTKVKSFYDEKRNELGKVNMMSQKGSFAYSDIDEIQATVLELPYGDSETSRYSFLILLPYFRETVSSVYTTLNKMTIKDILYKLNNDTISKGLTSVFVSLPRFKISTNVVLNKPLNDMGITDIFDPALASFESATDADNVYVSAIVHKADIEVTEVGTIASSLNVRYGPDLDTPYIFNADRPFIYFVVEKTTTTILFSGVYSKPLIF